jgi:hypothetical protein
MTIDLDDVFMAVKGHHAIDPFGANVPAFSL